MLAASTFLPEVIYDNIAGVLTIRPTRQALLALPLKQMRT